MFYQAYAYPTDPDKYPHTADNPLAFDDPYAYINPNDPLPLNARPRHLRLPTLLQELMPNALVPLPLLPLRMILTTTCPIVFTSSSNM